MIAINSHKLLDVLLPSIDSLHCQESKTALKKKKKKIKMYSPECVVTISNLILSSLILIKHS